MFYLLAAAALAAEPATLGASPPSGADLERVDEGWRFERNVEIDGQIVSESGLAIDGQITKIRWSASGKSADVLAAWHTRRSPEIGCQGPRDRWVGVRDGVVYTRATQASSGEWRLTAEEVLDPSASCVEASPQEIRPAPIKTAPPKPKAKPLAVPAITSRASRPEVADDPPPAIERRIQIESTDLSEQPIKRIAGWCLAEYPGSGLFRWADQGGAWRLVPDPARSPENEQLASCMDAMLAPMPARGTITITLR